MSRVGPIEAGLLNALRKKREVEQPEQIAVGGELPEVDIEVVVSQGLIEAAVDEFGDAVAEQAAKDDAPDRATLSLRDAVGKERTILLGMPGAFTPACDEVHLPDYIKSASELAQAGVEQIAVMTTNDVYVNKKWLSAVEECIGIGPSKIAVIADGDGDAAKALGLAFDAGFGLGTRSKRFAMVLDEGIIKHVAVDEGMEEVKSTSVSSVRRVLPSAFPASVRTTTQGGGGAGDADADQQKAAGVFAVGLLGAAAYLYSTGQLNIGAH